MILLLWGDWDVVEAARPSRPSRSTRRIVSGTASILLPSLVIRATGTVHEPDDWLLDLDEP